MNLGTANEPASLTTLPVDVLLLIADSVAAFPRSIATSTLLSLSLTCRAWSEAAQPALHREPFLSFLPPDTTPPSTFRRLSALLRTLEGRPDLASAVRTFDLGRYTVRCISEAGGDRRSVSRLAIRLLSQCTNLRTLTVPFVTQADKPDLLHALRQLTSLETFTFGEGATTETPWVVNVDVDIKDEWGTAVWIRGDFASLSWKRLRRFRLEARIRVLDSDPPIPWQLESFELALRKNVKVSGTYLDKLLSNCRTTNSLRHLSLKEHQLLPSEIAPLLEVYGASLETLETTTADLFTPNNALFSSIPSSCPSLVSLRLGTPVYDLPFVLDNLAELPHLRRLALDTVLLQRFPGTACATSALAEQVRRFPSLEHLSLCPGVHGEPDDDGERFAQFQLRLWSLRRAMAKEGRMEVVVLEPFS